MNKTNPKFCSVCGHYPNRPVAIDAIILIGEKILLIKRGSNPYRGYWAIPGGHVSFDEDIEKTVKREVKEETNLEVESMKLVGVYGSPNRSPLQTIAIAYFVPKKKFQ